MLFITLPMYDNYKNYVSKRVATMIGSGNIGVFSSPLATLAPSLVKLQHFAKMVVFETVLNSRETYFSDKQRRNVTLMVDLSTVSGSSFKHP